MSVVISVRKIYVIYEVENAFPIFKVSRLVRVHTVHITIVITK